MDHEADIPPSVLQGRSIVVAVCGGIAAFKVAQVVSALAQRGAVVDVAMTAAARKFVTPLTFATLSGRPVFKGTFSHDAAHTQHIAITEKADLMLVAPATSNIIAKVACGLCDDLVSLMISAAPCPVVFAPAMNNRMWENPIARENREKLAKHGYKFIEPAEGWLACRNLGAGRLAEPEKILSEIEWIISESVARGAKSRV